MRTGMEKEIKAKKEEIKNAHGMRELSMEEMENVSGGGLFDGIRKLGKKLVKTIRNIF